MLEIKGNDFLLDGKKFNIYSGAMHYFRIPKEYWEDRLTKLKLAGFNTVETYMAWNIHEPKKDEFNFSGDADVAEYIKIAQKVGLKVIVRPGPYICAEWEFGGFPAWLHADKNMRLRCYYEPYLEHVKSYFTRVMKELKPLLATNGGPIIAMQVENEYGSYGNDKKYLNWIKDLYRELGVDILLFTSDGDWNNMLSSGSMDGTFRTINFGSNAAGRMKALDQFPNNGPKMCMEFWCGWFDHWGEKHHTRNFKSLINELNSFFDIDASFNFYMFHGGTNFGFMAGANHFKNYQPTVTSYDYCALLNEYGDYTPQYHAVREFLHKKQNLPLEELPESPKTQALGEVKLDKVTSLWDNLDNIGEKHYSGEAQNIESYGQSYGLTLYKTKIEGKYSMQKLSIEGLHDRCYLYIDGEKKAIIDTVDKAPKKNKKNGFLMSVNGKKDIEVLVDVMGRTNYGDHINDYKGISGIKHGYLNVLDYEVTTLPLDNLEKLDFSKNSNKYPLFYKGSFKATSKLDCFVKVESGVKGYVWVNGINLGRYWNIGPQRTLYLPGCWLKEDNEIIVLELEGNNDMKVSIIDHNEL